MKAGWTGIRQEYSKACAFRHTETTGPADSQRAASISSAYPILPVRYAFVRSSSGQENIVFVSPYSTSSPKYMNIECEEIRIACPIL